MSDTRTDETQKVLDEAIEVAEQALAKVIEQAARCALQLADDLAFGLAKEAADVAYAAGRALRAIR